MDISFWMSKKKGCEGEALWFTPPKLFTWKLKIDGFQKQESPFPVAHFQVSNFMGFHNQLRDYAGLQDGEYEIATNFQVQQPRFQGLGASLPWWTQWENCHP